LSLVNLVPLASAKEALNGIVIATQITSD